jgi:Domain of unknown function (DUF3859)
MKATRKIRLVTVGLIIIGLALLCPFVSQASEVDNIEIIDFGLYKTTFATWQEAPNTQRGEIEVIGSRELIRRTKRIPGKGGTEFGIRYVVNGQEEGSQVDLLVRVLHSASQTSEEWTASRQIGSPSFDGWKLDAYSQITPEKLTIQLFHHGVKLAEKSFTVY